MKKTTTIKLKDICCKNEETTETNYKNDSHFGNQIESCESDAIGRKAFKPTPQSRNTNV